MFNQTVLGVVPVGNLSAQQRKQLVNEIKKNQVYKADYGNVKRHIVAGRPQYSYNVEVHPAPYVAMLKAFAHDIGITELERVDPAQYQDTPPLKFNFTVDVWSGELQKS